MVSRSDPIRVGIIRCDTHAFWYAHLFEKPDPVLMRKNHRGCHYYFYRRGEPSRLRFPPVSGMRITRVFQGRLHPQAERFSAKALSEAFNNRPKVCDSFEEVSDDVDLVYIADCDLEGKDHLRYATPGLKKGVPHFVDKPFAYRLRDARKMIELADRHHTAVMCASLLRYSPHLEMFGKSLANIAPISRVDIPGCTPSLAGIFHGISAAQNIMGYGCEWVESMGSTLYDVLRLHYPGAEGGTEVILFNAMGKVPGRKTYSSTYSHCAIFLPTAYGAEGTLHAPPVGDYDFPYGGVRIVKMAKRMAQTRKPPIEYASMLEPMEIIEAARLAHNKGKRVSLEAVR